MRRKIKIKGIALVALLAVAGLFSVGSLYLYQSNNQLSETQEVVAANGQQEYLYCRIKDDVTYSGDIERFCACFYNGSTELTNQQWPGNAYPGNKLKIVKRGGYIYGRTKVPTGVTATHVVFNNGDGWNVFAPWQRTARKQFNNHTLETYVLDTAGGAGNISGYWTSQLFIDMNDSVWNTGYGGTYSNIKAHLWKDGGSSITTWPGNAVTFVNDFLQDETKKGYGFIELPKDGSQDLMSVIPDRVIFNINGGKTNQDKTETLTIPYTENNVFKINSDTGNVERTGTWISPWQTSNKGVVYLDISECIWSTSWSIPDDELRIYYFDDSGAVGGAWPGSTMSKITINGKSYFKSVIPSGAKYCIANAWSGSNVRDTTGDLIISGSSCLLKIDSTFDSDDHHQRGSWLQMDECKTFENSPSSTTGRMFMTNQGLSCDGKWASSDYYFGLRIFGGVSASARSDSDWPVTATTYHFYTDWFNGQCGGYLSDRYYTFVDIPYDGTKYQFVLLDKTTNIPLYFSDCYTFDSSMFTYVHYLRGSTNDYCSVTKDVLGDANNGDLVGMPFVTYLFQAYDTCSNANENGCGQIDNLIAHFLLLHPTQAAESALYHTMETREVPYPDHPEGGYTKSLAYIIAAMQSRPINRNNSYFLFFDLSQENGVSSIVIIITSSLSLLSITALSILLLKKRKIKETN